MPRDATDAAHPAVTAGLVLALALVGLARAGSPIPTPSARAQPAPVTATTPATTPTTEPAAPSAEALRQLREREPLDPNAATAADLQLLPGIGPALAGRIVAYRRAHGPFRCLGDLGRVRGIGPKTLDRLSDLVDTKLCN